MVTVEADIFIVRVAREFASRASLALSPCDNSASKMFF
jgi:hypothetical protein